MAPSGVGIAMKEYHIPSQSKAFVLRGPNGDVAIVESTLDQDSLTLKAHEALVAPKKTGICGSDIHFYKDGRVGDHVVEKPMVLGHESAGIVLAVGSRVIDLVAGDRVAMEPGETCGICSVCKDGKYELCSDMVFAATPPNNGTLQSVYKLPAHLCYKLPKSVSLEEGALIEPLSVAIHATHRIGGLRPNQNVVVFGAGPVGLLVMAACKASAARRVIAVDVVPERLAFAKDYAATDVYTPTRKHADESTVDYCRRNSAEMIDELALPDRGIEGIDLIIECTGAEVCLQTAVYIAKTGATIVQVGIGNQVSSIPSMLLLFKQLKYLGSFRYGAGVYQTALDLVGRGKISLAPLITHRYQFAHAREAFEAMVHQKGSDGKPPIKAIIDGPTYD